MSPKAFIALMLVTAISVAAAVTAVYTEPDYAGTAGVGKKALPNLMETVDEVARIRVVHPEKTLNIKRDGDGWVLGEADDYPAVTQRVGKALLDLAQLELYEPKTKLKELQKELWLGDPKAEGGQAKLVTLYDKDDKVLSEIVLGRTKFDVEGSDVGGVYLRRADEDQTWLAKGEIDLRQEPRDWFARDFMEINYKRFKTVVVRYPDGTEIRVSKEKFEDEHYVMDNIPEGKKLKTEFEMDDIPQVFAGFRVDDVWKEGHVTFPPEETIEAVYTTFDGLRITTRLWVEKKGDDEISWMTFAAETLPDAEAAEATKVNPVEDAEKINKHAKGWVYDISDYRISAITRTLDTRLDDIKPES